MVLVLIKWLLFSATFILPFVYSIETEPDYVINITSKIPELLSSVIKGLQKSGFEPMVLPNLEGKYFKRMGSLHNGVLTGVTKINVCGDWILSFYGALVRNRGRFCADEVRGKFNYMNKCVLDVSMKNITSDMSILYNISEKTLSDPQMTVEKVGDTEIFIDECWRNFKRIRLPKHLESSYRKKIIDQAQKTAVKLGEIASTRAGIINLYNKVADLRKNDTGDS